MPQPLFTLVQPYGVTPVRQSDSPRKRILPPRDHKQMHMIAHQAIRPYIHACLFGILLEELKIYHTIRITQKNVVSSVPPMCNVMGNIRNHYSC